jgi:6-pyruvoyltetrahydropterin/6-carboxytetrahydropterin synthase
MYTISKEFTIDAAHRLVNYIGKCGNVHGHTYRILVTIQGETLDALGMLVDFGSIKAMISTPYDHKFLNDLPEFSLSNDGGVNPTAENMARVLWDIVSAYCSKQPHRPRCTSVTVWETPTSWAEYKP